MQALLSDGIVASVRAQDKYPLDFINGMLAVDTFSYDMNFTELGDQLLKQIDLMSYGRDRAGTYTGLGADAYALLIHVMNQCLEAENKQTCINEAIRFTLRFEGIKGFIFFDEKGKAYRSLVINTIKDGKMAFIVQVY